MSPHKDEAAQQIATTWARTLWGLKDAQLQVAWVREQVQRLGADRAADVLTIILARAEQREERYASVLLRSSMALAMPELSGLKRAIAYTAEARGQGALARFLGSELVRTPSSAPSTAGLLELDRDGGEAKLSGLDPALRRALEGGKGRPLSLGERKSLARRRDRALLTRAVLDPHPDVIGILLDNPALTELDVVRLCARRPAAPEMLTLVFRHARWVVRYRVRLTLVLNPYTPEEIALQLLPHLTLSDRKAVARSGDLAARVREACDAPTERSVH
ncbi:MAG: hypothetical protein JWN48_5370 [Myxococcaceae bacterium]|nr:hypothetical protein [Myxococcaceae bacterium]